MGSETCSGGRCGTSSNQAFVSNLALLWQKRKVIGECWDIPSGPRANGLSRPERRFARSEEHTSELQSLMRISYAVFCLKKKKVTEHYKQETESPRQDETIHNKTRKDN